MLYQPENNDLGPFDIIKSFYKNKPTIVSLYL